MGAGVSGGERDEVKWLTHRAGEGTTADAGVSVAGEAAVKGCVPCDPAEHPSPPRGSALRPVWCCPFPEVPWIAETEGPPRNPEVGQAEMTLR